jgi:hypothetical protein
MSCSLQPQVFAGSASLDFEEFLRSKYGKRDR